MRQTDDPTATPSSRSASRVPEVLSAIFDTADFLMDQVLHSLNVQVPPGSGFDVSVSFDRPPASRPMPRT